MHSLLQRQLRRSFEGGLTASEAWDRFIKDVDEAYRRSDVDRQMLERSLDLSSQELLEANAEIRTWAESEVEASKEYYRALIENASDVITVVAPNGEIRYSSPSIQRVLGYDPDEMVGQSAFDFVHADDLPAMAGSLAAALANQGHVQVVQFRFQNKVGAWRTLEAAGRAHSEDGEVRVIVNSRDVTDRLEAEHASRESSELFSKAFQASPAAIAISDGTTGAFLKVNKTFLRLLGYTSREVIGRTSDELELWIESEGRQRFTQTLGRAASVKNFETVFRAKSGDVLYGVISAEVIELQGRRCVLSITHDITERKQAEQTINHLAYHDPLTGLPNRSLFTDRLNTALARARRHRETVAVMFLDLDRFKLVNDTLGHAVGDNLLQAVASELKQLLREEDTVARIGGDEFTILLPGIESSDVSLVAERVLVAIKHSRFVGGREMRITTSIG